MAHGVVTSACIRSARVQKHSVDVFPEFALLGDSDLPEIFKWSASSAKVATTGFSLNSLFWGSLIFREFFDVL